MKAFVVATVLVVLASAATIFTFADGSPEAQSQTIGTCFAGACNH